MTLKTRYGTKRKSGISPVIATIILIAITIVIAVAVAGWVFGLFGSYTRGPAVTINAASSSCTSSNSECYILVQNSGGVTVNVNVASIDGNSAAAIVGGSVTIAGGQSATVSLTGVTLVSGETVSIVLGLSSGSTISTTIVVS